MNEPSPYRIEITKPALKVIRKLPRDLATRIKRAIDGLATDPRPPGYIRLKGSDLYRVRVGSWRVIYAIEDDRLIILIMTVVPRGGRIEI